MSSIFYNSTFPQNLKPTYSSNDIIDFKIAMRQGRAMKAGTLKVSGNLLVQKVPIDGGAYVNVGINDNVYLDPYTGVASLFRNSSFAVQGSIIENIQYLPRLASMVNQANYTLEGINTSGKMLAQLCGTQNNIMLIPIADQYTSFSFSPEVALNKSDQDLPVSKFQEMRLSFNLANSLEAFYTTHAPTSAYMTGATGFNNIYYELSDVQAHWIETIEVPSKTPVMFETYTLVTQSLISANSFFSVTTPDLYNAISMSFIDQSHRSSLFYNNNRCEYVYGLDGQGGRLLIEINGNQGVVRFPILSYQEAAMNYAKSLSAKRISSVANAFLSNQGFTWGLGCAFVESQNDRLSLQLTLDPNAWTNNVIQPMDAYIYISGTAFV